MTLNLATFKRVSAVVVFAAVAVFMVQSASAEETFREKMNRRFETIPVTEQILTMPNTIVDAIEAYNDGEYYQAAVLFDEILNNQEWRALHETTHYYFAESLYRLELYEPCAFELSNILFKGPEGTEYFGPALSKLLMVTYDTKDPTVLYRVLTDIPLEKFPRVYRNELLYMMGRMYFDSGQVDEAYNKFSQVAEGSVFYAKANYFIAIILVQRKEYAQAKQVYEMVQKVPTPSVDVGETQVVKDMSKLAMGQLYYAAAFDASADKREDIFLTAVKYYDRVDRDNVQWYESLFEKTWAATNIGRYTVSLGTALTLNSPFFGHKFIPEIELIESITWYTLCKYKQARSKLNKFFNLYTEMLNYINAYGKSMRGVAHEMVYDDLILQYRKVYESDDEKRGRLSRQRARLLDEIQRGDATELHIQVLTEVLNDSKFLKYFEHVKELEREFEIMEQAPGRFQESKFWRSTMKKMQRQHRSLKRKGGRWALSRLKELAQMLQELIGNAHNIDFELTDAERLREEERARYNVQFKRAIAGREEELLTPAVPDEYLYWSFDGEFWKDELGYYMMAVEQECQ